MKAKGILLVTTAAVSLVAAQESSAHNRGWYIGIESGAGWVDDNSIITNTPDVVVDTELQAAVPLLAGFDDKLKFDTGWAADVTIGYGFEKNWRVELQLDYRKNDFKDLFFAGKNNLVADKGDLTEYSAMINVIYDVPLTDKLDLNIGVGAGADHARFKEAGFKDGDTRFAVQGIVGLSYAVSKRLDLTLTYRYLNVNEPTFKDAGSIAQFGDDVQKHTVSIGLRYDLDADEEAAPPAPPPPPPPPPAAPKQFIIYFGFDKCDISAEADAVLADAAATAKSTGSASISIVGHTDSSGSDAYNQKLSNCRATAAKTNLVGKGIAEGSIKTSGRGETELLVKTGDGVKEPQNRRATIDLN